MFAFSQIQPRTTGMITHAEAPLSRYLGASFDQGFEDSAFKSVENITEMGLADENSPSLLQSAFMSLDDIHAQSDGKKISAEDANNRYSLPGLTFDRPILEAQAALIKERRQKELERSYYLDESDMNPARWVGGLGVRMAGGMMNPLDLGASFMPVIGSEAEAANVLGRGGRFAGARSMLAHGLIPEEALAKLPAPKLMGAMISGTVAQAVLEAPVAIAKVQEKADYGPEQIAMDIIGGGIFAGGLHLAVGAAGRLFRKLLPETREVMMRKAMDDFVKGEDTRVADYVSIDENAIREKVKASLRDSLVNGSIELKDGYKLVPIVISDNELRFEYRSPTDEKVGHLDLGLQNDVEHPDLLGRWAVDTHDVSGARGKGLGREAITALANILGDVTSSPTMSPEAIKMWEAIGATREEPQSIRDARFVQGIYSKQGEISPQLEDSVKAKTQEAIRDFIEKKRQEYDPDKAFTEQVAAEIRKQVEAGKVLRSEDVEKYRLGQEFKDSDVTSLEKTNQEIMDELGISDDDITGDDALPSIGKDLPNLEDAIDAAADCVIKNLM